MNRRVLFLLFLIFIIFSIDIASAHTAIMASNNIKASGNPLTVGADYTGSWRVRWGGNIEDYSYYDMVHITTVLRLNGADVASWSCDEWETCYTYGFTEFSGTLNSTDVYTVVNTRASCDSGCTLVEVWGADLAYDIFVPPIIFYTRPSPIDGSTNTVSSITINTSFTDSAVADTIILNLNNTLRGWYRFNDTTGTKYINDSSGNNNNGTWSGSASTNFALGKFGNGTIYDGVNDSVNTTLNLNTSQSFTIMGWFNSSNVTASVKGIVNDRDLGNTLQVSTASSYVQFGMWNQSGNGSIITGTTTIVNNTWYHFAAVYNASSNMMYLYVNKVLDNSAVVNGTILDTAATMAFGRIATASGDRFFQGIIDDIQVYNRTLTFREINSSYDAKTYPLNATIYNLPNGVYTSIVYIQNNYDYGYINQTEKRTFTVLLPPNPSVTYVSPPTNYSGTVTGNIPINISYTDLKGTNGTLLLNWNKSLVAWYRMNDSASSNLINDSSGNKFNGTWNGSATTNYTTGIFGNATIYNNVSNYLNTTHNFGNISVNASFTISLWFNKSSRINGIERLLGVVAENGVNDPALILSWEPTYDLVPYLRFYYRDNNSLGNAMQAPNGRYNDSIWHNVVIIRNGTTKNLSMYVDKVLVNQTVDVTTTFGNFTKNNTYIGASNTRGVADGYANCSIDDVRIFNRTITTNEINSSYNARISPLNITFDNLAEKIYSYSVFAEDSTGGISVNEPRFFSSIYTSNYPNNIANKIANGTRPYQISVNISNATGTSNSTTIFCNGKCSPDFIDIKFVLNNNIYLPYWIENLTTGKLWVNVTGNGTVYMFYGNSSLGNVSSCDATFPFCDDFSSGVLDTTNKWKSGDSTYSAPTTSITNGILSISSASGWASLHTNFVVSPTDKILFTSRVNLSGSGNSLFGYIDSSDGQANRIHIYTESGNNSYVIQTRVDGGGYVSSSVFANVTKNTTFSTDLVRESSTQFTGTVYNNSGTPNYTTSNASWASASFWYNYYVQTATPQKVDYVYGRKYTYPEPVWVNWNVSFKPNPPTITQELAPLNDYYTYQSWTFATDGFVTDGYNTTNGTTWKNGTVPGDCCNFWFVFPSAPHVWSNLTIYAFNATGEGTLSDALISKIQVPNRMQGFTNVSSSYTIYVGDTLKIYGRGNDSDGDGQYITSNITKNKPSDWCCGTNYSWYNYTWTPNSSDAGTYYWGIQSLELWSGYNYWTWANFSVTVIDIHSETIKNLTGVTNNFYINWTFDKNTSNDLYNITLNGTYYGNTTNNYYNTTYPAHAAVTIGVRGYNSTAGNYSARSNLTTVIDNNRPVVALHNITVLNATLSDNLTVENSASDADATVIANFEGVMDGGFSLGCGGAPTSSYVSGAIGQGLKFWSTGGDGLGCTATSLGAIKPIGYSTYFYGKGYVHAWIYSNEAGGNSYTEEVETGCKTANGQNDIWGACHGGSTGYANWTLFRMVTFQSTVGTAYLYFYDGGGASVEEQATYIDYITTDEPQNFTYQWYENSAIMTGNTSKILDKSYLNNNKTYSVAITPKDLGYVLQFNGTSNYILTTNLSKDFSDETVTIGVKFNASSAGVIVTEIGQPTINDGWHDSQMEVLLTGEVRVRVWSMSYVSLGNVTFNTTHYAILRYNKTSTVLDGFLDGIKSASNVSGDRAAPWENGANQYYAFGAVDTQTIGTGAYFNGTMSDGRIYNRAVSDTEAAEISNGTYSNDTNLITLLRMNEGTGQTVTDYSERNNYATLGLNNTISIDDPIWFVSSERTRTNFESKFNGVNQYALDSSSFSINTATSGYSLSTWINQTSDSGYSWNSVIGDTTGAGFGISTQYGTTIGAWACGNYGAGVNVGNFQNQTHNVVAVYTQNAGGFTPVKMYFDGIYVGNSVTDRSSTCSGAINLNLAKSYGGYSTWFNGKMGTSRIYTRSLSDAEVAAQYNNTFTNESGLVALWKMREGTGQIITDDSGNGHHLILGATSSINTDDPAWTVSQRTGTPVFSNGVLTLQELLEKIFAIVI